MRKNWLRIIGVFFLLVISGCMQKQSKESVDKLQVVATNSILADITATIGGDKIALHSIVPVGKDPHEYEPLADDVQKVAKADVIFYNGINLETGGNGWFTKLMTNANKVKNRDYFAASDGIEVIYLSGEKIEGKEDPHAWLNLENGINYAQVIARQLQNKDAGNAGYYQQRLGTYVAKLQELDEQAKSMFASIPESKKLIVTSEGSFNYFSKAYGVPSASIWQINTEEEGTPGQLIDLIRTLRQSEVPVLFVESSVNARPMQTVARDTELPIYAELFTDSIAKKGEEGDSYYAMMEWNLRKIAEGLMQ